MGAFVCAQAGAKKAVTSGIRTRLLKRFFLALACGVLLSCRIEAEQQQKLLGQRQQEEQISQMKANFEAEKQAQMVAMQAKLQQQQELAQQQQLLLLQKQGALKNGFGFKAPVGKPSNKRK